jgi:hypothetical protein
MDGTGTGAEGEAKRAASEDDRVCGGSFTTDEARRRSASTSQPPADDMLEPTVNDLLERAFFAERVARMEHHAATFLATANFERLEWYRQQPDYWDGPRHSESVEGTIGSARSSYQDAEATLLEAAGQYYTGRPAIGDPHTKIQQLPSPLREEVALLRDDYLRDDKALTTDLARLDRQAEYVARLSDRVSEALNLERSPDEGRSR